jgi:RHS repeat-associated protein
VEAYSYDPVHNRLSSQHQPGEWRYNADNQLLGYGLGSEQVSFEYNANGHTERETTGDPAAPLKVRDYRYNAAERLVGIDENGQALGRYRYDPMGRRVYKETATETTWFLYTDEGLVAELQADGTLKRAYGWKPQGLWGTDPLWLADRSLSGEWTAHVYHNDHLWTPQRLTALDGAVTWSGRSEAFGLTVAVVDAIDNPLRFPGQYWDGDSGLDYNRFRDYRPSAARYAQADPVGLIGGINIFAYANQNPLMAFDELGLWAHFVICEALNVAREYDSDRRDKARKRCRDLYDAMMRNTKETCDGKIAECNIIVQRIRDGWGGNSGSFCVRDCYRRADEYCSSERARHRDWLRRCLRQIGDDVPPLPDCGPLKKR